MPAGEVSVGPPPVRTSSVSNSHLSQWPEFSCKALPNARRALHRETIDSTAECNSQCLSKGFSECSLRSMLQACPAIFMRTR